MRNILDFLIIVFLAIALIILCGCKQTTPSISISNSVKNDLKALSSDVKELSSRVVAECPSIAENVRSLSVRIDTITGQVGNISLACETEKNVLKEKLSVRELWIGILAVLCVLLGYFLFRFKRL